MTTKHFKHIHFNTTNQVEYGGFIGRLTGKNDLIFLRNKWQTEIDNSWAALMNMAHYLETCEDSVQTILRFNDLARFRGEVHDANVRRAKLYENVFKYIQQDQAYSERMWKIHQEMYKSTSSVSGNCSTSLKNINVTREDVRKYVETYPRIEIKNDIQMIKDMEAEANRKKSKYRQDISLLRSYFEQFKLELIKCESKYDAYNKILEMGISELNSCRFKNSLFYSTLPEQRKNDLRIDVLKHRVDQVERTLAHYRDIKAKIEKELEIEAGSMKKTLSGEFEFGDSLDSI
ncbi:hypothetical protein [Methanosarcina sp. 2.H.A.1B.4]|uniref:hypothetical protein n=1 Tax=Methanosarcina sp. 2.H.A.1B.4 TaxID=1483600 RepID=UPI000620FABE|nr:hypothetical protein [Methanosarcina sp. 2.H.A.1B.4]KKG09984.1 hypothetical protein EO92_01630 [Methanosarcina sp. 2.H.A.1B.4]